MKRIDLIRHVGKQGCELLVADNGVVVCDRAAVLPLAELRVAQFEMGHGEVGGQGQAFDGGLKGFLALRHLALQPETPAQAQLTLADERTVRKVLREGLKRFLRQPEIVGRRAPIGRDIRRQVCRQTARVLAEPQFTQCHPRPVRGRRLGILGQKLLQRLCGAGQVGLGQEQFGDFQQGLALVSGGPVRGEVLPVGLNSLRRPAQTLEQARLEGGALGLEAGLGGASDPHVRPR